MIELARQCESTGRDPAETTKLIESAVDKAGPGRKNESLRTITVEEFGKRDLQVYFCPTADGLVVIGVAGGKAERSTLAARMKSRHQRLMRAGSLPHVTGKDALVLLANDNGSSPGQRERRRGPAVAAPDTRTTPAASAPQPVINPTLVPELTRLRQGHVREAGLDPETSSLVDISRTLVWTRRALDVIAEQRSVSRTVDKLADARDVQFERAQQAARERRPTEELDGFVDSCNRLEVERRNAVDSFIGSVDVVLDGTDTATVRRLGRQEAALTQLFEFRLATASPMYGKSEVPLDVLVRDSLQAELGARPADSVESRSLLLAFDTARPVETGMLQTIGM